MGYIMGMKWSEILDNREFLNTTCWKMLIIIGKAWKWSIYKNTYVFITWNQDLKDHRSVWYVSVCSAADKSFLFYSLISEKPSQLAESKGSSSFPSQDVRVANAETPQCFLGQIHALEEAGGKKKKKKITNRNLMPRGWRDLQSQVPEIRLRLECVLWGLDRGRVQRLLTGKQSCNGTRMRRGGQGGAPTPSVNALRLVSPYENGAWNLASSCAWGFCLPVMVMTYIW